MNSETGQAGPGSWVVAVMMMMVDAYRRRDNVRERQYHGTDDDDREDEGAGDDEVDAMGACSSSGLSTSAGPASRITSSSISLSNSLSLSLGTKRGGATGMIGDFLLAPSAPSTGAPDANNASSLPGKRMGVA